MAQTSQLSTTTNTQICFDFELLTKQCGDEKSAVEMATMFLADLPDELKEIEAAHEVNDWSTVQKLTHKLHGGVSYCAASRLGEACSKLETAIKTGDSELFEEFYNDFLNEVSLAKKAMKAKLH